MDKKRILLISLFFVSIIIFGWGLYSFFFRGLLPTEIEVNTNRPGTLPVPGEGQPGRINENANAVPVLPGFSQTIDISAPTDVAQGGFTKVVDYGDTAVQDLISSPRGSYFYNEQSGLFYSLQNGTFTPLSETKFFNVENVTWAPNQDKAVIEYPDGSNIVYDFTTNKQVTLPKELTDFSFSPQGTDIAGKWIGKTNDENWLMVGASDGTNFRLLEPLGDRGHNVEVDYSTSGQVVALVRDPADADTQTVLPIGLNGENFKSFRVEGLKFESSWAPSNDTLLYSVTTQDADYGPKLMVTGGDLDSLGTSHLDLQLKTWSHKCTFNSSSTSIYCAEPSSMPRGAGLYPELASGIPDVFYRIDLRTGQKIPLAIPIGNRTGYSAQSVFLSQDETQLYFVDEMTKRLHSIRLQ